MPIPILLIQIKLPNAQYARYVPKDTTLVKFDTLTRPIVQSNFSKNQHAQTATAAVKTDSQKYAAAAKYRPLRNIENNPKFSDENVERVAANAPAYSPYPPRNPARAQAASSAHAAKLAATTPHGNLRVSKNSVRQKRTCAPAADSIIYISALTARPPFRKITTSRKIR